MSLPLPAPLLREGREVLGIPLGTRRNEHVLRAFPELRSEPGYRVEGLRVERWNLEGFFSEEGRLYLFGPGEPGRLLDTALAQGDALQLLARLAAALIRLGADGVLLERLQTDSVVFLDSGAVLFLPPGVMKKVSALHPSEYKLRVFELSNHPDWVRPAPGPSALRRPAERLPAVGRPAPGPAGDTRHLSFSLGALAYRVILGAYPFEAETEEEIHNRTRYFRLPSPALRLPGLRTEVATFLMRALGQDPGPVPSLQEWGQALSTWVREGLRRPLEDDEQRRLTERATSESGKAARGYLRRVFWQRKGLTVLIATAVIVTVGVLAGSYLRNLLAPRVTQGYSPREIVEGYLQGLNTLDHTLMQDCTVDGAGKQTIREVINVYVLSRVSMGYEGKSNVLPADEWDRRGRPPLVPPETVFGITDLELRMIRGEPEPEFEATYTRWVPVPAEGEPPAPGDQTGLAPQGPTVSSSEVSERFFLKTHRGDWVIYRIDPH